MKNKIMALERKRIAIDKRYKKTYDKRIKVLGVVEKLKREEARLDMASNDLYEKQRDIVDKCKHENVGRMKKFPFFRCRDCQSLLFRNDRTFSIYQYDIDRLIKVISRSK